MNVCKQEKYSQLSGKQYHSYNILLTCHDGFQLTLSSIGASIRQLLYPFPDGSLKNIVLSFADDDLYFSNSLYAGATLAPCSGRISYGQLSLRDTTYLLSCNENNLHTLHGGYQNAAFSNWNLRSILAFSDSAVVTFDIFLSDGLDGFPGNRKITAVYTLLEDHTLTLHYEAVSDKDTYFNISNHTYFNFTGDFSLPILDHTLQVQANQYVCNRADFIPEDISPVEDTPFDFRTPTAIRPNIISFPHDRQLAQNHGYNHAFVLNHSADFPDIYCTEKNSPVKLNVSSDAPCMVLYTGGFIEPGLTLQNKQTTSPSCALAFEFQDYPDAPGKHGFPYSITSPGETWTRNIQYKFLSRH